MPMTAKRQRFVLEFLIDLNATQAAIRAGYSKRTAKMEGSRLLGRPDVQAAILDAKKARAERTELDAEWVVRKLIEEALNYGPGSTHSGRVRALELLGRHLWLFEDRVRVIPGDKNEPTPFERRLVEFRKRYGDQPADSTVDAVPVAASAA
jgi:Terminase small subunit